MSSTGLSIEGENKMSREEYQQKRMGNYRAARDAVFGVITNGAREKIESVSSAGQTRVCIYTYDVTSRDDTTYVFGSGGDSATETFKGLYVKTIFNARGVPREETLLTKLYQYFNNDGSGRRMRIYQKFNHSTTPKRFEIYVDWTPQEETVQHENVSDWRRIGSRGQTRGRARTGFRGGRGGFRGGRGARQQSA
jgi:hypothetical protein